MVTMAEIDENTVLAACRELLANGESPTDEAMARRLGSLPGCVRRIRKSLKSKGLWDAKPQRTRRLTESEQAELVATAAKHPGKSFFDVADAYLKDHGRTVRETTVGYAVSCWQERIAKSLLASKPDASLTILRLHIRKTTGFSVGTAKAKGWIAKYGSKAADVSCDPDRPLDPSVLDRLDAPAMQRLTVKQLANIRYKHTGVLKYSQLLALRAKSWLLPNITAASLDSAITVAMARGLNYGEPAQHLGSEDDGESV